MVYLLCIPSEREFVILTAPIKVRDFVRALYILQCLLYILQCLFESEDGMYTSLDSVS